MTPSSDWKREPMILRIDGYSALRSLDPGDVDLAHGHHRFECSPGRGLVGIAVGPQQRTGCDLPRKAPAVLAPAALAFLPAIADDGIPIMVGLFLVVGQDHEADRLISLKIGSAVQADERPASTVNSIVSSVPAVPPGKSDGACMRAPTLLSGKVAA